MLTARRTDSVGFFASTYILPAGNGLPDLEVTGFDPLGWVNQQAGARNPDPPAKDSTLLEQMEARAKGRINEAVGPVTDAVGGAVDAIAHPFDTATKAVGEYAKNIAIVAVLLLLGAALVILGVYQFTKD